MPSRRRHRKTSAPYASDTLGDYGSPSKASTQGDMESLTPSERFRAAQHNRDFEESEQARFIDTLGFRPDQFQLDALNAVEKGCSVLVAAPTGAGKTVVGEFATFLAHNNGTRAFYTTPIKALSNQKFTDLGRHFGADNVGLMTGDTVINPDAPIIVMTTEVLRNMIYAGSDLTSLSHVVLDEVHYLADRFRGPVWEEVIIHLPKHVSIVALSATVSNAEEFGAWMRQVRGNVTIVVSEDRPVPLHQHMIVGPRIYDLYRPGGGRRINNELLRAVANGKNGHDSFAHGAKRHHYPTGGGERGGRKSRNKYGDGKPQVRRESRAGVLHTLSRAHLLPAIVFIFSRAGCEDAVSAVAASPLVLTTTEESETIRAIVDDAIQLIPQEDHMALGIQQWAWALERGIAAHHAGLLPIMKETVEKLFTRGLIKVVYATETLALGINMPARTVVIESLRKWNGVSHVQLSPGEYTQLTGRAGRRGIDTDGHAVVLHQGRIQPEEVSSLASRRTYPLISAFRPTYNMVVNLLSHSSPEVTREVLESSFAQFQADDAVVGVAHQARELRETMNELAEELSCSQGDAREYFNMREELARLQKESSRSRMSTATADIERSLVDLGRGDVIGYQQGRHHRYGVVTEAIDMSRGRKYVMVLGTDAKNHQLGGTDLKEVITKVGHVDLPAEESLRKLEDRRRISGGLRELIRSGRLKKRSLPSSAANTENEMDRLHTQIRHHRVHSCPHRENHAHIGHAWARTQREYLRLVAEIDARTDTVAREFDRVCSVLEDLHYLTDGRVNKDGQQLRKIFGDRDLLLLESVRGGSWDGLDAAGLAAIASTFVFESRSEHHPDMKIPGGDHGIIGQAWTAATEAERRVRCAEEKAHAPLTPQLDAGLLAAVYAWAKGASLSTTMLTADLSGGDVVRWIRQVIDILNQLTHLDQPHLAQTAREAHRLLNRGVVAWSTT